MLNRLLKNNAKKLKKSIFKTKEFRVNIHKKIEKNQCIEKQTIKKIGLRRIGQLFAHKRYDVELFKKIKFNYF